MVVDIEVFPPIFIVPHANAVNDMVLDVVVLFVKFIVDDAALAVVELTFRACVVPERFNVDVPNVKLPAAVQLKDEIFIV